MLRLTSGSLFLFGVVNGDTYMHWPRGSNNRLNEKSANRANGNRMFDSQNNNRGGYNVGETGNEGNAFDGNTNFGETPQNANNGQYAADIWDVTKTEDGTSYQYQSIFQESSLMRWTWTSQHGCGNAMNNCNMVLQMGCENVNRASAFSAQTKKGTGQRMLLRDGGNTNQPDEPNGFGNVAQKFSDNNDNQRGRHESEEFYAFCEAREREKGLFTADQKLKGHTQKYTRQNPNGARRGLECPEERDYFPWEFPTPWIDLAWIGNDVEYCKTNIAPFSQNVYSKGVCAGPNGADDLPDDDDMGGAKTATECANEGGTWVQTTPPDAGMDATAWANKFCQQANWSQINHLGNVEGTALGGQMDNYLWQLPSMDDLARYGCQAYTENGIEYYRVVARQRYNISTMDYDPYQTFADQNNDPKNGVISPVTQNPTVDVGAYMQGLRLALNTAQTGRTFQDRSHVFAIARKPANTVAQSRATHPMLNIGVRGKRGNIVQTFPAVEYDFEPNDVVMSQDQCIHLQWTGSNTHNNGNPAGDGQAGDAGEGRGGTDRSNLMEMKSLRSSYPMPYDVNDGQSFFDVVNCKYPMSANEDFIPKDMVKAIFATAGYYYFNENNDQLNTVEAGGTVNPLLNNVSASFKQGLVCCTTGTTPTKDYYFTSTRNNNFTNRSQKLKIRVVQGGGATFQFYKA